jgi:hypothetical protein
VTNLNTGLQVSLFSGKDIWRNKWVSFKDNQKQRDGDTKKNRKWTEKLVSCNNKYFKVNTLTGKIIEGVYA